ncbi:MAG: hypothetical protein WDM87_00480 [Terracidiphilus sp.]
MKRAPWDTGIPEYKIPANVDRSQLPLYEHQRELYQQKVDAAKLAVVAHDIAAGICPYAILL